MTQSWQQQPSSQSDTCRGPLLIMLHTLARTCPPAPGPPPPCAAQPPAHAAAPHTRCGCACAPAHTNTQGSESLYAVFCSSSRSSNNTGSALRSWLEKGTQTQILTLTLALPCCGGWLAGCVIQTGRAPQQTHPRKQRPESCCLLQLVAAYEQLALDETHSTHTVVTLAASSLLVPE
jgi:hypothetical protein